MSKLDRYIIGATVAAIIVFLIWYFSNIVGYILVAAVLSLMGKPLVDLLCKLKIKKISAPKWLAAGITLGVLSGIGYGAVSLFMPLILERANAIGSYNVTGLIKQFEEPLYQLDDFLQKNIPLGSPGISVSTMLTEQVSELLNVSVVRITSLLSTFTNLVIGVFSVLFITFFFLKEEKLFFNGVVMFFPNKYESNAKRALNSTVNLLSRYFIGLVAESVIKLIFITVGLYLIGISFQDSIIIALISAILNVIPYIGPLLGGIIGVVIGVTNPAVTVPVNELMWKMILVFILFQIIDNIIIQPYVYSSSVKAHPLEIFLVILAAGSMAGIVGMLLAIPAYTVIRVFAKEFFNNFPFVQKLTENI